MEENNLVPFASQRMTIQPSLFAYLDDDLGELDDDQKAFGRRCVFHVSHDSSAIEAREKGVRKPQSEKGGFSRFFESR